MTNNQRKMQHKPMIRYKHYAKKSLDMNRYEDTLWGIGFNFGYGLCSTVIETYSDLINYLSTTSNDYLVDCLKDATEEEQARLLYSFQMGDKEGCLA